MNRSVPCSPYLLALSSVICLHLCGCGLVTDRDRFEVLVSDLTSASSPAEEQALIDRFFTDVAYSNGFPIRERGEVLFVVELPSGVTPPIRLAGDFNAWNPESHPLDPVLDTDLYSTVLPARLFRGRSRYKFVVDDGGDGDWMADPHARRYEHDALGEISLVAGGAGESHLERYPDFESTGLAYDRDIEIYLPPGYAVYERLGYPVLYMHDGQNLYDPYASWGGWEVDEHLDELLAAGMVDPMIVVGIDSTPARIDEYTHVEDVIDGSNARYGGDAPLYVDFIVNELKPFIDARYRTRSGREETGILGSSLGGLVSLWAAFAHGDVFGRVGGMSSTLGWGSIRLNEETVIEIASTMPKFDGTIYVDSGGGVVGSCYDGDGDGIRDDNPESADNFCETEQFVDVLIAKGYIEGTDFFYVRDPWAPHNEAAWSQRFSAALEILFPPSDPITGCDRLASPLIRFGSNRSWRSRRCIHR